MISAHNDNAAESKDKREDRIYLRAIANDTVAIDGDNREIGDYIIEIAIDI